MHEFKLPDLGEGIHEGEILKWYVGPGDSINEDDPLVDVETDKAALTIPSPRSGTIVSLKGEVGDTVLVGDVITVFGDAGETAAGEGAVIEVTEDKPAVSEPDAPPEVTSKTVPADVPPAPAPDWGQVVAAPATRRLARELKIDIRQVPPTGPGGRVTPEDVQNFAERPGEGASPAPTVSGEKPEKPAGKKPAPVAGAGIPLLDLDPLPDFAEWGPVETEPLRSIRRKVARKMVTSMILVPHVAHMDDADVTLLEEFRKREENQKSGRHLTLLPFVVKAVSAGLRAAPAFNASLDAFREIITYKKYYNIGVAVDTGHGLIVPVIRDTDSKSILRISEDIEEAAAKARSGDISVADLRGGTFTITNVGPLGGTALIPTINYPEVAILGMGRVQEKPVVRDGEIVIRKILPLTLAFDHRIADGADAARFVSELARQLSDPNVLLLET